MQVNVIYRNDPERELLDPLPEKNGIVFRLVRGDLCDPMFGGWFKPPWPKLVLRHTFTWMPLPFLAWRLGRWTGYIGAKVYGVHHEQYLHWLPAGEVFDGSQAFCFSLRPFARPE